MIGAEFGTGAFALQFVMWAKALLRRAYHPSHRRHPEVLAASGGEPRRMGHKRKRPSFETPRKRAALSR
jgi:hypothetical protein